MDEETDFRNILIAEMAIELPCTQDDQSKCKFCGRIGHGKNPKYDIRKTDCPAFDKICKKCNRRGHFTDKCLKKGKVGENFPQDRIQHYQSQHYVRVQEVHKEQRV